MGQREYTTVVEDERTASPHESSELEQACKYLEGELRREDSMDGVKIDPNINGQLENGMFLASSHIAHNALSLYAVTRYKVKTKISRRMCRCLQTLQECFFVYFHCCIFSWDTSKTHLF